jgi:retinol dehydrogenase-13
MKKTAIITGSCGAIGKAIAEGLAREDFEVVITSRSAEKLDQCVSALTRATGNTAISGKQIDLSNHGEIKAFAAEYGKPLHLLINNAAVAPVKRSENSEGTEMQWAVNVLSYHRMIAAFVPYLKQAPGARIVNVASYWAGELDLKDVEFRQRHYNNDIAYRQSKQADRMLSAIWAEKLKSSGIVVNACHPGDVNSRLSNDLGFGGHESPEEGAANPLWLALSKEAAKITGIWYEHGHCVEDPFAKDQQGLQQLDELLQSRQI